MSQSLIDEKSREMLLQKFQAELRDDVSLQVFVGEENKEHGDFAVQLVEELHKLDSRIKPTVYRNGDGAEAGFDVTRTPTILIGWDKGYRIKYTGAPVGHEAGGFIDIPVDQEGFSRHGRSGQGAAVPTGAFRA